MANKYKFFLIGEDSTTWEAAEEGAVEESPPGVGRRGRESGEEERPQGGAGRSEGRSPSWAEEMEHEQSEEDGHAGMEGAGMQTTLSKWIRTKTRKENSYPAGQWDD